MEEEIDESVRPENFELIKLPIPVPPNLEIALRVSGERAVPRVSRVPCLNARLFIEDDDHQWPGAEAGGSLFCRHPAMARALEAVHVDLQRTLPIMAWDEWIALPPAQREEFWAETRYLLLDRRERMFYAARHPNVRTFC
jgi:hypothetical protein